MVGLGGMRVARRVQEKTQMLKSCWSGQLRVTREACKQWPLEHWEAGVRVGEHQGGKEGLKEDGFALKLFGLGSCML